MTQEPTAARRAIGTAIQDLAAKRLGRGFIPVGLAAVIGVGELVRTVGSGSGGWVLVVGAVASGVTMLMYGQRIVQRAFGRAQRGWMTLAMIGSVVPPTYSLYVLGWRGLRGLASAEALLGFAGAILFTLLGVWVLRGWMKVVEIERLAAVMAMSLPEEETE